MTINQLCKNLQKKGLDARPRTIYNLSDGRSEAPAIMVYHDYNGPYPTEEAYNAAYTAREYARKHNFYAETRGMCTGTIIYPLA